MLDDGPDTGGHGRPFAISIAVLLCVAVGVALAFPRASAQQRPAFRTSAELVVLHVAVLSDDKPAAGLLAEDFRITEEGRERPVSVFVRPQSGPGEFVIAVDASGSMNSWPVQEATNLLLDSMHDGTCVLLLPFRESMLAGVWGHPDDVKLRRRLAELEFHEDEAILDAILVAFGRMRERGNAGAQSAIDASPTLGELMRFRRPPDAIRWGETPAPVGECEMLRNPWDTLSPYAGDRRGIIVVTDGADHKSRSKIEDVLMVAWGSGLPVFVLAAEARASSGGLSTMGSPNRYGTMRALERLTEYTGGVVFRGVKDHRDKHRDVWIQLQRLIGSLQARYILGYVPERRDGDASFVDRRKIRVEVRKPGYEVLAQSHVVRGRAAKETSALDLALRGFQETTTDRPEQALRTFDAALAVDPELAWAHYGRGIVLAMDGEAEAALTELQQAEADAPWLPDLDARQAELLIETGDLELAWERALQAHAAGSHVEEIVDRLQELAPREIDFSVLGAMPTVRLQAGGGDDLLTRTVAPIVLSAIGRAVWNSQRMLVAREDQEADLNLMVEIDRVRRTGTGYSMSGWMVLSDREGHELREVRLNVTDVEAAAQRDATVAVAFEQIESAAAAYLASQDER